MIAILQRLRDGAIRAWSRKAPRLSFPLFGRSTTRFARPSLPAVVDPSNFNPLDDARAARYVENQSRTPRSSDPVQPFSVNWVYPLASILVPQGETLIIYEINTLVGLNNNLPEYDRAAKPPNPYYISDFLGIQEPIWALRVTPIDAPPPTAKPATINYATFLGDIAAEGLETWDDGRFAFFAGHGKFPLRIPIRERQRVTLWGIGGPGGEGRTINYLAGRLAGLRFSHRDNPEALRNLRSVF